MPNTDNILLGYQILAIFSSLFAIYMAFVLKNLHRKKN